MEVLPKPRVGLVLQSMSDGGPGIYVADRRSVVRIEVADYQ